MSSSTLPVYARLQRVWRAWTGADQQELETLREQHEVTWELLSRAVSQWQTKYETLEAELVQSQTQLARAHAQLSANAGALTEARAFQAEHTSCQQNWEEVLDLLVLPRSAGMAEVREVLNPSQIEYGWENHPLVAFVANRPVSPVNAESIRHLSALIMRLKRMERRRAQGLGLRG